MSQNRILRRIFGPKRDELTGGRIKLRNKERHELCSSQNIIWVIKSRITKWAEHVARMGERRGIYRVLVGNPEETRPLGKPRPIGG